MHEIDNKYIVVTTEPTAAQLADCVRDSVTDCPQNNDKTKWLLKLPLGVTMLPASLAGETMLTHAEILEELNSSDWVVPVPGD